MKEMAKFLKNIKKILGKKILFKFMIIFLAIFVKYFKKKVQKYVYKKFELIFDENVGLGFRKSGPGRVFDGLLETRSITNSYL